MSDVYNEIKQKAIKLNFIFCKKSFEIKIFLETVMFKKKKLGFWWCNYIFQLCYSFVGKRGNVFWSER